ncbi:MAG: YbaK/prolyl-tRNA synthetase associated region [Gammaproteobacteria bacterium]|nr:YbaK/prolyl-tRNA synthetase associated region [Gammaproteobacteria bacterium]
MITEKLKTYLCDQEANFHLINHVPTYTAQETAEVCHISGKTVIKTVILKVDGKFIVWLQPANHKVDLTALAKCLAAKNVELASESEFQSLFPDAELGAMPPFGHLYNLEVYVEDELAKQKNIAFNAGTHCDLIEMSYKDFERLECPKEVHLH